LLIMQTLNPQGFTFGGTSNLSPSVLRKSKDILPIPSIPEESYSKDKQSDEPVVKKIPKPQKNLARHSSIVSTSMNERSFGDHRSLMIQNASGLSMLKSREIPISPNSVIDKALNAKKLRKFGTFAETAKRVPSPTDSMLSSTMSSSNVNRNIKFVDKSDWHMATCCYICTRDFNRMGGVFEHHCRACGNAVCGECSSRKIEENRVCESCFFKSNNARAVKRREDQLKSKNATMKTYKKQLGKEKDDLADLIQKRYDLDKKVKDDKDEQRKNVETLQKERDKATEVLSKKKDTNVKLKESLEVDKNFLKEKEVEYEDLRNKINSLKLQVMQKKNNYESKKEELQRLLRQKLRYEESPSFLQILNTLPVDDSASIHDAKSSTFSTGISNKLYFTRDSTKV